MEIKVEPSRHRRAHEPTLKSGAWGPWASQGEQCVLLLRHSISEWGSTIFSIYRQEVGYFVDGGAAYYSQVSVGGEYIYLCVHSVLVQHEVVLYKR